MKRNRFPTAPLLSHKLADWPRLGRRKEDDQPRRSPPGGFTKDDLPPFLRFTPAPVNVRRGDEAAAESGRYG